MESDLLQHSKRILLISPQPWGNLHISKHHYAVALAKMGHEVYFLNPPFANNIFKLQPSGYDRLQIVDGGFKDSLVLRYHFKALYKWKVKTWIRNLLKQLPTIDIVWCFETNIINSFTYFKEARKIFHVVDPVNQSTLSTAATADMLVTVSNRILQQFSTIAVPVKMVVNHALAATSVQQSLALEFNTYTPASTIKVGYVGNLYRKIIDTDVVYRIIRNHPEIEFHFWGPGTSKKNNNLGGEDRSMAENLSAFANVVLHDAVPSSELITTIHTMDIFLLAYKKIMPHYDASNSHKVLEYLATGKVVVSTYLDEYNKPPFNDMIRMSDDEHNEQLPTMFKEVVQNIEKWNEPGIMEKRRAFACSNTYETNAAIIIANACA